MNYIFAGLILLTVGIVRTIRERAAAKGHTHKCPKCGAVWHHAKEEWPTVRALVDAHTCPKCGAEQFDVDKIGGIAVNIGARVAARAGASEVLVSQTVKDLTAGSGLRFEDAGEHDLKGVPGRWRLYRVRS